MSEKQPTRKTNRITCKGCGGSGQISFFRGVSRFVMDWDDCPDCLGTGSLEPPATDMNVSDPHSDPEASSDQ